MLWQSPDYTPVYMTGLDEVKNAQDLHTFIHRENHEPKSLERRISGALLEKSEDLSRSLRMEPCHPTDRL